MINYQMDYCFGDLECVVTFDCDGGTGLPGGPDAGCLDIISVCVGGIDISRALTVKQMDEIAYYASDYAMAA